MSDTTDGFDTLEFPLEFSFKAMCKSQAFSTHKELERAIAQMVTLRLGDTRPVNTKSRPSRAGTFLAVTVSVRIDERSELEAVYQQLSDSDYVVMTL